MDRNVLKTLLLSFIILGFILISFNFPSADSYYDLGCQMGTMEKYVAMKGESSEFAIGRPMNLGNTLTQTSAIILLLMVSLLYIYRDKSSAYILLTLALGSCLFLQYTAIKETAIQIPYQQCYETFNQETLNQISDFDMNTQILYLDFEKIAYDKKEIIKIKEG